MVLDRIIEHKRRELRAAQEQRPLNHLRDAPLYDAARRDFAAALIGTAPSATRIIAEVKKASPSKGVIRADFDHLAIAAQYAAAGAAAISVLTDHYFFKGCNEFLADIRQTVHVPVLRKDFIIDPYQVYEARSLGADALLLITAVLQAGELADLISLAHELGMQCLVEVHTPDEVRRAEAAGARIIGINNRDLQTFNTDIGVTSALSALVPAGRIIVSESGIRSRDDIAVLKQAGVHAFLIGETLMRAPDPGRALRSLINNE